jgi:hypothetical protein
LTLKYLDERKEMLQNIAIERKDWTAAQERLLDRYDLRLQTSVEAITKMTGEMHALRNRMQEFITKVEIGLSAIEKRLGGGKND